jgi:hypothetical protein
VREPERLLGGGATDFERQLLESVREERPSPELTSRMGQALGISMGGLPLTSAPSSIAPGAASPGAAVSPGVGAPAATGAAAPGASLTVKSIAVKATQALWLKAGVGTLVGTGLAVSAVTLVPRASNEASPSPAPSAVSSFAEPVSNELNRALPEVVSPNTAPDDATLREEIVLLDDARAAFARRDLAAARSRLEQYRERFPRGALSREARVLWSRLGAGPWRATVAPPAGSGVEGALRR